MEKDKETKATEEREGSQVNQNVVDFGSAMTKTAHGTVYTLAIIGQIEGHTAAPNGTKTTQYEHMLPLLAKLEESREVDGILFLLNTVGGDVEAGLALADRRTDQAHGGHRFRGQPFHWRPIGGGGPAERCGALRRHDHPSRADERNGHRRASDLQLFSAASGADRGLCGGTQPDLGGEVSGPHAGKG